MAKKKSSLFAYFLNVGTVSVPTWASLGKGITALSKAMNAQKTTETYINEDAATTSVDSYQQSISVTASVWDGTSAPALAYLETKRDNAAVGSSAETQVLEVDLSTASPYTSRLFNSVVSVDSFDLEGGAPQSISATIDYNGSATVGTTVVTDGVPVFTATGISALALSSSVPAADTTGVSRSSSITLTFNNKIVAEAVELWNSPLGTKVTTTKSLDATGKILTITPSSTMAATARHAIVLSGVADIYGQTLATGIRYFTTGA